MKAEEFTDEVCFANTISYDLFHSEMEEYNEKMNNFIGLFIDELEFRNDRTNGFIDKKRGKMAPSRQTLPCSPNSPF